MLAAPPDRSGRAGPFTAAFVGRLEQGQKRVFDLPPVWRAVTERVPAARLLVAGDGPDAAALREALTPLPGVEWQGRVPAADVPRRVLDRADALLMPSSWETGPIVIWEAFARGAAVVSSRYVGSGLEGALTDGANCLLFDVGDAAAASAALVRLARDPDLRRRVSAGGFETVRTRYSADASADAWESAFRSVLAAPPAAGAPPPVRPAGRLDGVIGPARAERVRRVTGRVGPDAGPGGEWPHALSAWPEPEAAFLADAARLDRPDADASRVVPAPAGAAA